MLLAGCGMPETARSAKQVEQAVDGVTILFEEATPLVDKMSEPDKAKMQKFFSNCFILLQSAKISLQPTLTYLGEGKEIKVDTTAKDAARTPETFASHSAIQAGRAAAEVDTRLSWENTIMNFLDGSSGWLVGLSIALTGSGALGLLVTKVVKTIQTGKDAVEDAVAYGKKIQTIDPKDVDAIELAKTQHSALQVSNGTKSLIDEALIKVKAYGQNT